MTHDGYSQRSVTVLVPLTRAGGAVPRLEPTLSVTSIRSQVSDLDLYASFAMGFGDSSGGNGPAAAVPVASPAAPFRLANIDGLAGEAPPRMPPGSASLASLPPLPSGLYADDAGLDSTCMRVLAGKAPALMGQPSAVDLLFGPSAPRPDQRRGAKMPTPPASVQSSHSSVALGSAGAFGGDGPASYADSAEYLAHKSAALLPPFRLQQGGPPAARPLAPAGPAHHPYYPGPLYGRSAPPETPPAGLDGAGDLYCLAGCGTRLQKPKGRGRPSSGKCTTCRKRDNKRQWRMQRRRLQQQHSRVPAVKVGDASGLYPLHTPPSTSTSASMALVDAPPATPLSPVPGRDAALHDAPRQTPPYLGSLAFSELIRASFTASQIEL